MAANLLNRRFLGIDQETNFLDISRERRKEIENPFISQDYKNRLLKQKNANPQPILELHEIKSYFERDLPF